MYCFSPKKQNRSLRQVRYPRSCDVLFSVLNFEFQYLVIRKIKTKSIAVELKAMEAELAVDLKTTVLGIIDTIHLTKCLLII